MPRTIQLPPPPTLKLRKIGLVSRDYRHVFPNGRRDFSFAFWKILRGLDQEQCDGVIFSMYSIEPRTGFDAMKHLQGLEFIKVVMLEEFDDGDTRTPRINVVYSRIGSLWQRQELALKFGSRRRTAKATIEHFVDQEIPQRRILGNCGLILCGELNALKYSPASGNISDPGGLLDAIPDQVSLIVNPTHDRMTRFEMPLKRQFLSQGRWLVSVWNKGKASNSGRTRDGSRPAWDVYFDGEPRTEAVNSLPNDLNVDIGLLHLNHGSTGKLVSPGGR